MSGLKHLRRELAMGLALSLLVLAAMALPAWADLPVGGPGGFGFEDGYLCTDKSKTTLCKCLLDDDGKPRKGVGCVDSDKNIECKESDCTCRVDDRDDTKRACKREAKPSDPLNDDQQ